MQIAIVGLGRMGGNMAERLLRGGHEVVAFDRDPAAVERLTKDGATGAASLDDVVKKLAAPRAVWVMLPPGSPTEDSISTLAELMQPKDVVIDGGNSNYKHSQRRSAELAAKGIRWLDAGTSGGVWGLENGYCLMVGGDEDAYEHCLPALKTLAPENGLGYFGKAGAGHFAKMIHNGIEYAMMEAYAEGFEILQASEFGYDLRELSKVWNHGSVVRSWLLELAEDAFERDPGLKELKPWVDDSGEGRWTVEAAIALGVPAPAIAASLFQRFFSREENSFGMRVLAALRNEFGGHAVKRA
jgi:6-phosphogluconate dehydrogenase